MTVLPWRGLGTQPPWLAVCTPQSEGCAEGRTVSLSGVAVHHPDAADLPHRLPGGGVSVWRHRDGHCAERGGMYRR